MNSYRSHISSSHSKNTDKNTENNRSVANPPTSRYKTPPNKFQHGNKVEKGSTKGGSNGVVTKKKKIIRIAVNK